MADNFAGAAWSKDWDALNRQYWNAWSEAARQGGESGGKLPWHEGLEQWSRLFAPKTNPQHEVVDRMLAGARQFFGFAQAAAQQAGGKSTESTAAPWSDAFTKALGGFSATSNPMLEAMRSLAGEGAMGWEQLAAETHRMAGPFKQEVNAMLSLPTVGFTREHQERFQKLAGANVDYQEWSARYNALLFKASQRAIELMETKFGVHSEPGRELTTLRAVYDLWIDAAEEGYAEVALTPEFREVYGNMVNAQMGMRKLVNAEIERSTQMVGMPTRTEINTVHERLHDMRRRIAELEEALAARGQAASRKAPRPKSEPARAKRVALRTPVARARPRPAAAVKSRTKSSAFAAQLAASRKSAKKGRK